LFSFYPFLVARTPKRFCIYLFNSSLKKSFKTRFWSVSVQRSKWYTQN
jgi:hypothetical protein